MHDGTPFRWGLWVKQKQLLLLIRTHLSHFFAVTLAVLVLGREFEEIQRVLLLRKAVDWLLLIYFTTAAYIIIYYGWLMIMRKSLKWYTHFLGVSTFVCACVIGAVFGTTLRGAFKEVAPIQWLILTVTLGTLFATIWEFVGDKITTSPQEIWFSVGIRSMLLQLENFCFHQDSERDALSLDALLDSFLITTQTTLCGNRHVEAGFMLLQESGEALELVRVSPNSHYPEQLVIPLPDKDKRNSGPAGLAFESGKLVYFPDKDWQESWLLEAKQNTKGYALSRYAVDGWIAAAPDKQDFTSGLCVPVVTYMDKGKKTVGVLNFSTKTRDPFTDRDFLMAECYATLLSQALTFREKVRAMKATALERQTENQSQNGKSSSGYLSNKPEPKLKQPRPKGKNQTGQKPKNRRSR